MTVLVTVLRGINVPGRTQIRMEALRQSCAALGLTDVHTYLQSGNVIFRAVQDDAHHVAGALKGRIAADFGHDVEVLVLTARELARIAASNPLWSSLEGEDRLFHATFLLQPIPEADFRALELPIQGEEQAVLIGQVVMLYCPHGYGKTKLSNAYFEKALGVPATTRNWRTVLALRALAAEI